MALKQKTIYWIAAVLVCAVLAAGTSVYMAQADGSSWIEHADTDWYDPIYPSYKINTAEQLAGVAKLVNEGSVNGFQGKILEITQDIQLGGGYVWEPIGTEQHPFRGSLTALEGETFTIRGMTLPQQLQYGGLVGYMESGTVGGYVFDVSGSIQVNNNNQSVYVGAAVGKMTGSSIVYNITNNIVISVNSDQQVYAGGIVGWGEGDISTSLNYGTMTVNGQDTHVGGIVGYTGSYGMKMKKNANHITLTAVGSPTGSVYAGGIVGYAQGDLRMDEENTPFDNAGHILAQSGLHNYAGGIIGRVDGELTLSELTSSKATVEVSAPGSASSYAGGIAGSIHSFQLDRHYRVQYMHTQPVINNGGSQVHTGGIAGYVNSDLTWHLPHTNINEVTVSGTNQVYTGGLFGRVNGELAFEGAAGNAANLTVSGAPNEAYTGGVLGYGGSRVLLNSAEPQAYQTHGTITVSGGTGVYTGGITGNRAYARASGEPSNNVVSNTDLIVNGQQKVYTGGYIGWIPAESVDKRVSGATYAHTIQVTSTASAADATVSTGGIVGYAHNANVDHAVFSGSIQAVGGDKTFTGGIVGSLQSGTLSASQAGGTADTFAELSSDGTLGGIAGYLNGSAENVTVRHIRLTATTPGAAAGGIAGSAQGTITGATVGDPGYHGHNSLTISASTGAVDGAQHLTAGGIVGHNETALSIRQSSVTKVGFMTEDGTSQYTLGGVAGRLTADASVGEAESMVRVSQITMQLLADDSSFGGAIGAGRAPVVYTDVRDIHLTSPADRIRAGGIVGIQEGAISSERSRMESRHVQFELSGASASAGGSFGEISGDSPRTLAEDIQITATGADNRLGGIAGYLSGSLTDSIASSIVINTSGERTAAGGIAGHAEPAEAGSQSAAIARSHLIAGELPTITVSGSQSMVGGIVGHAIQTDIQQPVADGELPNYVILSVSAPEVQAGGIAGRMEEGGITGDLTAANLRNVLINTAEAAADAYIGGVSGYNDRAKLGRLDGRTVNLNVRGPRSIVGGMAGYNRGTHEAVITGVAITDLYVQVISTAASSTVGGYVGINDARAGDAGADPATAASSIQHSRVVGTSTRAVHVTSPATVTGGMVGENRTLIANNSITDKIPVTSTASQGILGGLVGRNTTTGTLYYTYANATMTIEGEGTLAGGLVGRNEGHIQASYVDIDINGQATGSQSQPVYLGGLAGWNTGHIKQSHTSSVVTAGGINSVVGGFVGNHESGTITDAYVIKNVRAVNENSFAGGFAGRIRNGEIAQTYSTARVVAENGALAGGYAGRYDNASKNLLYKNFYIKDEGKQYNNDLPDFAAGNFNFLGVLGGLSTLQTETLKDRQIFPGHSGWDFVQTWKYASPNASYQYPELNRTANTGGQGGNDVNANINWYMNDRGAETYVLTTEAELAGLAALVNGTVPGMESFDFRNRIIELGGKVSIQSQQWVPIGFNEDRPFQGTFDGKHYLIDGLTVQPVHDYSGLFGVIGEHGTVRNMTLEPSAVAGMNYTGVLAGYNKGRVTSVTLHLLDGMEVSGRTVGSVIGKNTGVWEELLIMIEDGSRIVGARPESTIGGVIGENEAELQPSLFEIRAQDGSVGSDAELSVIGGIVGRQTGDMSGFRVSLKPEFTIFSGGGGQTVGGLIGEYVSGKGTDLTVIFDGGVLSPTGEQTIVGGIIGRSSAGNTLQELVVTGAAEGIHLSGKGVLGGAVGVKEGQGTADFDIEEIAVTGLSIAPDTASQDAVIGGIVGRSLEMAMSGARAELAIRGEAEQITAGGIVGKAENSIIHDAEALPQLIVTSRSGNSYVGGIAGVVSSEARDQGFDFGHAMPLYHGLYDARVMPIMITVNGTDHEANLAVGGLTGQLLDASIYNSDSQADFLVQGGKTTELGGIAGYSSGIIVRSYADGAIDAPSSHVFHVGGIVGHTVGGELHYTRWQGGSDSKLTVGTAVSKPGRLPGTFAGGFVGTAERTVMSNVSTEMNVAVQDDNQDNTIYAGGFGGLTGTGDPSVKGELTLAYATGDVMLNGRLGAYAGGFSGAINHYLISDSYAAGNISNTGFDTRSGGFAGEIEAGAQISRSYALQDSVKTVGTRGATRSYTGGFAGYNDGLLHQVHAGAVAISVEVTGANVYKGSLVGYNFRDGRITGATVDSKSDLIGHNRGPAPSYSEQAVNPLGETSIWTDRVDTHFLSDAWEGELAVRTVEQLNGAVLLNNERGLDYYRLFDRTAAAKLAVDRITLTADLDLEGRPWQPFAAFNGIFDGGGHTISGLTLHGVAGVPTGFVSENAGTIRDLRFVSAGVNVSSVGGVAAGINTGLIEQVRVDAQINGEGTQVGGITGRNDGTISQSLTTGRIETANGQAVGGIAGENTSQGVITEVLSYAEVHAEGERPSAGGIAGVSSGIIEYSSSTGTVHAGGSDRAWAGGIAGQATDSGTIRQSLAGGQATAVSDGILIAQKTYFGGIAGQKSDATVLTGNVYNSQMLKLNSSFYNADGIRVPGDAGSQGLTGQQLTGGSLPGGLAATHWQPSASFYPQLKNLQTKAESRLGAATVVLHAQDLVSRIERDRAVALSTPGISWTAARGEALVSGAKAQLATTGPVALKAAAGGLERTIRIQQPAPRYSIQAASPVLPAQVSFKDTVQITLTTTEPGGRIYYTTDGRTPNETSQVYSGPIELKQTTTIRAITIAENKEYSSMVTGVWTKETAGGNPPAGGGGGVAIPTTPQPKPEPEPEQQPEPTLQATIGGQAADGTVRVAKNSKLVLTAPAGQTIYYTTDGSEPTKRSKIYKGELILSGNTTVKAITSGDDTIITLRFEVENAHYQVKENASEIRYISAYENQTFKPNQAITRYELIEALAPLLDMQQITVGHPFSDVKSREEDLVGFFASAGIIEGYPNGTFGSSRGLTRAEFVVVLSRVLELETAVSHTTILSDVKGHWSEGYVNAFTALGLIQGFPDGTFRPQELITRAQAVTVINRMVGTKPDGEHAPITDVNPGHWAYEAIMSAIK
ncbi:chitobiase/beta-hexosaminidase C-terminal domain-containing protein [Paenibacillus sp. 1P07SE]|uniref:chitobiase/beta-hexosaminidase C-terminal domain-containing protein n=1 Tax=Paenibacillus sp. 1P07SE TaxID=3132209 RepID=UPI0039A568FD